MTTLPSFPRRPEPRGAGRGSPVFPGGKPAPYPDTGQGGLLSLLPLREKARMRGHEPEPNVPRPHFEGWRALLSLLPLREKARMRGHGLAPNVPRPHFEGWRALLSLLPLREKARACPGLDPGMRGHGLAPNVPGPHFEGWPAPLSLLPSREKARMRGYRAPPTYWISNSTCTLIRSSSSPPLIEVASAAGALAIAKDSAYTFAMGAPAAPSLINVGSPRLTPARLAK